MPLAGTVADPVELNLYPEWREPATAGRIVRAVLGSLAVHVLFGVVFLSLPDVSRAPVTHVVTPDIRKSVHLVAPKMFEPTQKAPNQGKVTHELDVRSSVQTPHPQAPKFHPPAPAPGPVPQAPLAVPSIEPPKIEVAATAPPPVAGVNPQTTPQTTPPPPP